MTTLKSLKSLTAPACQHPNIQPLSWVTTHHISGPKPIDGTDVTMFWCPACGDKVVPMPEYQIVRRKRTWVPDDSVEPLWDLISDNGNGGTGMTPTSALSASNMTPAEELAWVEMARSGELRRVLFAAWPNDYRRELRTRAAKARVKYPEYVSNNYDFVVAYVEEQS